MQVGRVLFRSGRISLRPSYLNEGSTVDDRGQNRQGEKCYGTFEEGGEDVEDHRDKEGCQERRPRLCQNVATPAGVASSVDLLIVILDFVEAFLEDTSGAIRFREAASFLTVLLQLVVDVRRDADAKGLFRTRHGRLHTYARGKATSNCRSKQNDRW
jgi:hypothetical protein